jgi:hypothetical protein
MSAVAITREFLDRGVGIVDLDAMMVAIPASLAIEYPNDGNVVLIVRNTGAAVLNVTAVAVPDPYGRTSNETIQLPIGTVTPQFGFMSFANPAMFNSGGQAQITFDTLNGTYALLRLTKAR